MADNKVKFLRGTSGEYAVAEKDSDTIYFTTDDGKLYIGDKEVSGDGSITIDDTLSDTSTNPVQNNVIKQAIDNKADKSLYGDTTINVGRKAETDVGKYSTAEGHDTTASGTATHAEGAGTIANGARCHAEGLWTIASGSTNHAEGTDTTANGNNSCHAEGRGTTASGIATHAEGSSSNKITDLITDFSWNYTTNDDIINAWNTQKFSVAHGRSSHVEGSDNLSLGHSSHAEGNKTIAVGVNSHTSGYYTKALHDNEAAYGKYNESNDNTLFSIGDGTADDARHNAFEITTTGGKLHDKDIVTDDMSLPANGGNADTVDGMHANNFITGEAIQRRTTIDDCITAGTYTVSTVYTTDMPTTYGIWGICDVRVYGLGVFQTIKYTDTAIVICRSKIEGQIEWTKWKEISTTPIKKMTFTGVAIYEGGGGILFSIDHGTPIAIACTSRRATQCTQFVADNTWYVLAKDATTLDPVTAGSYSFDVWYI